ncbi:MAG: transposase [Chitinophagales bacterium]
MDFVEHHFYHVYNRGNQKQLIFFKPHNYDFFLKKMEKELSPHCDILSFCLMPNHFHWLLHVKPLANPEIDSSPLSNAIGILLRSYTRAIQKQNGFTGSLFQQKTKSKQLQSENQFRICVNYIHQNPMKADLVAKMEDWEYSSFQDYCGIRQNSLCNQEMFYTYLGIGREEDFYRISYKMLRDADIEGLF